MQPVLVAAENSQTVVRIILNIRDQIACFFSESLLNIRYFGAQYDDDDKSNHILSEFKRKNDLPERDGNSGLVLNVLDEMLKDSLERLKTMRDGLYWAHAGISDCTFGTGCIVRALCMDGKLGAALSLWSKLVQKGFAPNIITHNCLINALCKTGDLKNAELIVQEMLRGGPSPSCATYNTLVKGYCLINNVDRALDIICTMRNYGVAPNIITHNYLINALCKTGDLENAELIVQEMLRGGPSPSCATYNTLIKGYRLINNVDRALDIISTMRNYGVAPNIVTWNVLVHTLCKKGQMKGARKFLEYVLGDNFDEERRDLITTTTLMDDYIKNGDLTKAVTLLEILKTDDQVNTVAYNVIIHGFCLSRDFSLAYAYLCEMFKSGLVPDVFTYNTLIGALSKEKRINEACSIFDVMSVPADHITYKMIIHGLCVSGYVDRATHFLLHMLKNDIVPQPLVWNVIIDGYGRCGNIQKALWLRDKMVAHGVSPSIYTYNALLRAQIKEGNIVEALSVKKKMRLDGIFPDLVTYNLLLGACNWGPIEDAVQIYDEMLQQGCIPDKTTHTELIKCYSSRGKLKEAEELLDKALGAGLQLGYVPFAILINKYLKKKEPDKAYGVYKKMVKILGWKPIFKSRKLLADLGFAISCQDFRELVRFYACSSFMISLVEKPR